MCFWALWYFSVRSGDKNVVRKQSVARADELNTQYTHFAIAHFSWVPLNHLYAHNDSMQRTIHPFVWSCCCCCCFLSLSFILQLSCLRFSFTRSLRCTPCKTTQRMRGEYTECEQPRIIQLREHLPIHLDQLIQIRWRVYARCTIINVNAP